TPPAWRDGLSRERTAPTASRLSTIVAIEMPRRALPRHRGRDLSHPDGPPSCPDASSAPPPRAPSCSVLSPPAAPPPERPSPLHRRTSASTPRATEAARNRVMAVAPVRRSRRRKGRTSL